MATGNHATLAVLGDDALASGFLDAVVEPVESEALGVAVLPALHPSYREMWLSRLGYDDGEYVAATQAQVDAA